MSVYRKDDNGNIKKIAGSLTQRINMHIFQTTHVFDTVKNEDNYIINESDAKPYISSIKDWTQYSINLSEPNQSSSINIKLGSQTLKLINNVKNIEIGTLNGVIQCHTEKLDNNEIFLDVVGTVVSLNGVEKTSINTDTTPTANSENLITSGGVHDYPAVTFAESERQKSQTDGAIVHEKQLSKITTLWTNPNPSNDFSSQTITLANDNYDYAIMLCASRANALDIQVSFLFEKGTTPILNYVLTNADAAYSVENMCRKVYRTNNTTLNIEDCYYSLKSNAATVSNSLLIPYKVIGIKMGE